MISRKEILVVEDNELNREMLKDILNVQYDVVEAENGLEAMDILKRQEHEIALILLDIQMPVMDGYTFLEQVKGDAGLAVIPVIVTTQSDSESDEVEALSHGATDFVSKPYHPQVILHRVASIINLRETASVVNQYRYDHLTGLYSKEFFYQQVRNQLLQFPDREYDIVCSDIENFKLFNDVFGVQAGDRLLKALAKLCAEKVGSHGICGRLGGDRFLCFVERDLEYKEEVFLDFSSRLRKFSDINSNVVLKWGVYEITDRSISVEQMCDRALLAAGSIKGQYHKSFAVYDDDLRAKLLREQVITDHMEEALAQGQFSVYFQPKYNLYDDQLAGAEALVRWIHPEWGFMSPGEFIPLFEKNGFITQLDQYVWEQVCVKLKEWREKGYPRLPVSVNVSRADVYQADLAESLMHLVEKYGVSPSELHLEITESAYTENPGQIISTVDRLRKLGFIIEMDDFGSGYSSLNMLNQMKMDILKLDMKFIQSETAKPVDQGILRFIVSLARWMNLSVVAEGVETREQLERLREIGCDYVQGYLFARPMPGSEFEEILKQCPEKREMLLPEQTKKQNLRQSLLVVDEDAGYREMVRQMFAGQYQVQEAATTEGALLCLSQCHHPFSAILLSLTLPDGGGFEILENLRGDQTAWRIPVLATGSSDGMMEDRAFEMDADDYISKPHTGRSLQRRVSRLLGMTACMERERQLQNEACQDYLTGLLNRRGLQTAMNSLRQKDFPLALYLFDLDELKQANDRFGHEIGDQMLRSFGAILRRHTRDTDIVSRYGGDEFVVILKSMPSEEIALKKGMEICEAFRGSSRPGEYPAACSVGITLSGDQERAAAELILQADQALYRAKRENKGGCYLWKQEQGS